MSQPDITKEEIAAILPKVSATIADALGCDVDEVKPDASLIDDLGAESIDYLDIVFRLEQTFKVKIPRGKMIEDARGDLSEAEFNNNGILTDAGLARLKAFMSEVPPARFKPSLPVNEIPRLFTPETFAKIVLRQQRAAGAKPA